MVPTDRHSCRYIDTHAVRAVFAIAPAKDGGTGQADRKSKLWHPQDPGDSGVSVSPGTAVMKSARMSSSPELAFCQALLISQSPKPVSCCFPASVMSGSRRNTEQQWALPGTAQLHALDQPSLKTYSHYGTKRNIQNRIPTQE